MSTPIAARTTPGFWEGILGVADMTEAERKELRLDMLENCEAARRKFADMRADVERVENLEKAGLEPSADEKAAYDAALPSVQLWREGQANGREVFAAMLDAVNLVEKKQADGLEPSADEMAAYEKAQQWLANARKTREEARVAKGAKIRASLQAIAVEEAKARAKAKAARESAAKAAAAKAVAAKAVAKPNLKVEAICKAFQSGENLSVNELARRLKDNPAFVHKGMIRSVIYLRMDDIFERATTGKPEDGTTHTYRLKK
jgi:hypothetical protein